MTIVKDADISHYSEKQGPLIKIASDKTGREIIEDYYIKKANDKCICTPSFSLFDKEIQFLDGFL